MRATPTLIAAALALAPIASAWAGTCGNTPNDCDDDGILDASDLCPFTASPGNQPTTHTYAGTSVLLPTGADCTDASASVAPTASLGHGVELGAGAGVLSYATVGAYSQLGGASSPAIVGSRAVLEGASTPAEGSVFPSGIIGRSTTVGLSGADVEHGDDVTLGRAVTIGRGARLGDSVSIGYGTSIGEDVVIADGVILGSLVSISDDAVIGPQAVLAREAFLGEAATVGANVILGPQVEVGAGALVGALDPASEPVRVRKNVTIGQGAWVAQGAVMGRGATAEECTSVEADTRLGASAIVEAGGRACADNNDPECAGIYGYGSTVPGQSYSLPCEPAGATGGGGSCVDVPSGSIEIVVSATGSGNTCTAQAPCTLSAARTLADANPGAVVVLTDDQVAGDSGSWTMQAGESLCSAGGAQFLFGRSVTASAGATLKDLLIDRGGSGSGIFAPSGATDGLTVDNIDIRNTAGAGINLPAASGTIDIQDVDVYQDAGGTNNQGIIVYATGETHISIANYDASGFQSAAVIARANAPGSALRMSISGSNHWTGAVTPGMHGDPDSMSAFGVLVDGQTGSELHADIAGVTMDAGYTGFYTWHPDARLFIHLHDNTFTNMESDSVFAGALYDGQNIDITVDNNVMETGLQEDPYSPGDFYDGTGVRLWMRSDDNATVCGNVTGNTFVLASPGGTGIQLFNSSSGTGILRAPNLGIIAADNGNTTTSLGGSAGPTSGAACVLPTL